MSKPKHAEHPEPGQKIDLSKITNIKRITEPGIYPDSEVTGFRLWVGKGGTKSYQVVGKLPRQPKPVYVTIGKHGDWTPAEARKEAERLRLLMLQGVNPNLQKDNARKEADAAKAAKEAEKKKLELTVGAAFDEFLEKDQKESTAKVYRWVVGKHFKDWLNKPIITITQDDVLKRFDQIRKESPSSAAHAMRILRAIFKTAQIKHGERIPELSRLNPVAILSHSRGGWNTVEPRHDYIHDEDLPAFYQALMEVPNPVARDYLLFCLLTGLRKNEACTLKWKDVDLLRKTKTITVRDTKNGQEHVLALSDHLCELLQRRLDSKENEYVFAGRSKDGHFSDPERPIKYVVKTADIEPFSSHSLRRTFATAADALGYGLHEVQRLLNHKPGTVTQRHYIQNVAERTREPMQRVNDRLLALMREEQKADNVVRLKAGSR